MFEKWINRYSKLFFFVLLLVGFLCIFYGMFGHASVPFGDESDNIHKAYLVLAGKESTIDPYILSYSFLARYVSDDPVKVHLVFRFMLSAISVVLLYLFICSFKRFERFRPGVLLVCLIWTGSLLHTTSAQYGNINIFAFILIFLPLVVISYKFSINKYLVFLIACIWAGFIRTEYMAVFYISLLLGIAYFYRLYKDRKNEIRKVTTYVLAIAVLFSFIITKVKSEENVHSHLYLALGQMYAYMYNKMNPEFSLSTTEEFKGLIDEVFDSPRTFAEAVRNNPREIIKFYSINLFVNSVLFIPTMFDHRPYLRFGLRADIASYLETTLLFLLCISGFLLWMKDRGRRIISKTHEMLKSQISTVIQSGFAYASSTTNCKYILPFMMSLAGIVPLVIMFPQQRYWLPFVPLLFLWISWCMLIFFEKLPRWRKPIYVLLFMAIILVSQPTFTGIRYDNKSIVEQIRENLRDGKPSRPILAGHASLGVYIFKSEYESIPLGSVKIEDLIAGRYDYFIVDDIIMNSIFWNKNKDILVKFIESPEKYSYRKICQYHSPGENIVVFRHYTESSVN